MSLKLSFCFGSNWIIALNAVLTRLDRFVKYYRKIACFQSLTDKETGDFVLLVFKVLA